MTTFTETSLATETAAATATDPFLASMTFALGVQRDCDCDECGLCIRIDSRGGKGGGGIGFNDARAPSIPQDVVGYMREHKRAKLATGTVTRRQERTLVTREDGASVYRLTMPPGAEPLVEYGNSHRVVVVDRLRGGGGGGGGTIKSIGRGIIGSSDEEKGRRDTGWEEGKSYFIPCNGGKALGWINEKTEGMDGGGNAVLYMVKLTPEAMDEILDEKEFTADWVREVLHLFQRSLNKRQGEHRVVEADSEVFPLCDSDHEVLKNLIPSLVKENGALIV